MRITRLESFAVRIPLKPERRMVSALGRTDVSEFVIVRVETDEGVSGVGEATVTPQWSGETVWGAKAMIDRVLAPQVLGLDPREIETINKSMRRAAVGNWFAKAAIEMACWDIAGRAAERPVYELLGGLCRDRTIHCRFSLGAYEADVAAKRAADLVENGFDTIKVKVGGKPEADIQRVQAVRDAIGPQRTLTIDANGGWSFDDAKRCLAALEECRIAIVEQPLERGDYANMAKLRSEMGCRILADESCFDEVEARELVAQACCDALTVYPGKHAGISRAVRIAQLAGRNGLLCTIGSNLEWDIGAAAMMHFIVATPEVTIEELPGDCLGPSYHAESIAVTPIEINGPRVTAPDRPGLGIEVDWEKVAKLAIEP